MERSHYGYNETVLATRCAELGIKLESVWFRRLARREAYAGARTGRGAFAQRQLRIPEFGKHHLEPRGVEHFGIIGETSDIGDRSM